MRISIGTVVMLVIAIALGSVFDLLVTAATTHASLQLGTALLGLCASGCGGFISRRGFVPIAIGAYSVFWALALYHVRKFPLDLTYINLISSNAAPIALSLACVGVGAFLGQYLARSGKTAQCSGLAVHPSLVASRPGLNRR